MPLLSPGLKQQLMAASSAVLRLCGKTDWTMLFERIHQIHKRATPNKMMIYKHFLGLFRLYNSNDNSEDAQQNFITDMISSK